MALCKFKMMNVFNMSYKEKSCFHMTQYWRKYEKFQKNCPFNKCVYFFKDDLYSAPLYCIYINYSCAICHIESLSDWNLSKWYYICSFHWKYFLLLVIFDKLFNWNGNFLAKNKGYKLLTSGYREMKCMKLPIKWIWIAR